MIRDGRYCPLPRRNCNGPGVFLAVCRQMSLRARQPFLPKRQTRPVASKTLGSPRCFPLKGISANLYRVAIDEVRSPLTKPPCARSESDYTPGVKIEGQGLRQSPPFPNPTTTYVVAGLEKGAIGNSYPNERVLGVPGQFREIGRWPVTTSCSFDIHPAERLPRA